MPQDAVTGGEGFLKGFERANEIGAILGARRLGPKSNEFQWGEKRVVIKSGPSSVVTDATLSRVDAVIFGESKGGEWVVYEVDPRRYRDASTPSRSAKHDDRHRQVKKNEIRDIGRRIHPPPSWVERVTGMFEGDPAFAQVVAFGKEAREADRPRAEADE